MKQAAVIESLAEHHAFNGTADLFSCFDISGRERAGELKYLPAATDSYDFAREVALAAAIRIERAGKGDASRGVVVDFDFIFHVLNDIPTLFGRLTIAQNFGGYLFLRDVLDDNFQPRDRDIGNESLVFHDRALG